VSAPNAPMPFEVADTLADVVNELTPAMASTKVAERRLGYEVLVLHGEREKSVLRTLDEVMQFVKENYKP